VLAFELLQRNQGWSFDLPSALIGALFAWLIAALVYAYRERIKQALEKAWAPVAAWRRRVQASQEEKYLRALKPKLSTLLFLEPTDPTRVFCPPDLEVAPPLPATIQASRDGPQTLRVPYRNLFLEHSRVVLTGPQDSGRTMTMIISAWQDYTTSENGDRDDERPERLPFWIDVSRVDQLDPDEDADPAEKLAELAALFMPQLLTKWIVQHWTDGPSLILLDNWSRLSLENRQRVAAWIEAASQSFDDPFWLVAAGQEGYGSLTEIGFVPAEMMTQPDDQWLSELIAGWADLTAERSADDSEGQTVPELETSELFESLDKVLETRAPLWEFHLRTALFFRTQTIAEAPQDAMEHWIEEEIPLPKLGDEEADVTAAELAQQLARDVLLELARRQQFEDQTLDTRALRELVNTYLPEEDERHPKLESATQRLLVDASFLKRRSDRTWAFSHPIWTDYFTALYLLSTEGGDDIVLDHLSDPGWSRVVSFYASQTDASNLVKALLDGDKASPQIGPLLRATQWAVNTSATAPWRRTLMKALAQGFMRRSTDASDRLTIGRALTQVAGNGARPFFLKMLQQPSIEVRVAAIRGLGWCGNQQDMRILGAALRDQNAEVRNAAVRSLRDMGTPGAAKFLAKSLDQADEALMLLIAEALTELPEGPQALIDAADHPDLLVRRAVAHSLGDIDQQWAEDKLIEMMKQDPEWLVRSAAESAIEAKEEQASQQATIPVPPKIDEIDWLIKWAAEQGMGLGIGDAAIETLVLAAQEGRDDVKILSALTLTRVGDKSHIPVLESMVESDESDAVQVAARQGLKELRQRYPDYASETEAQG
jgi:HEAT repeat protein